MAKKRVFISFDVDHDEGTKTMLAMQAKLSDSPFDFIDASVKEHLPGNWQEKVRGRINRADLVIILCGQYTHTAQGVAVELQMAKEISKPYFLLRGYADKTCTWPTTASVTDKMYDWTWPNLKALIGGAR